MTTRTTTFVLVTAVVLFVLPAGASAQQCIPVPGTPWCMPTPAPDPYGAGSRARYPSGNLYGDQPWQPPSTSPYGGYGNPPANPYAPLPGETVWGVPSRLRR